MKKFLLKLLLNKKQREIIWQAMIFSEYTYRKRGNIDGAAVVQTVINETQTAFDVVKSNYSKEEVDYIVAQVIKDTRAESEKTIKDAFRSGVDSCKKELENMYRIGFNDAITSVNVVTDNKNDENKNQESSNQEKEEEVKEEEVKEEEVDITQEQKENL